MRDFSKGTDSSTIYGRWLNGLFLLPLLSLLGCTADISSSSSHSALFEAIGSEQSGIHFNNQIKEDFQHFFGLFNYVYNGAGVAIGDINNDGLADLYFTANELPNKLYLNLGDFKFEDITERAQLAEGPGWDNGVVMADVNGDGWLDIYLSRGGWQDTDAERRNLLFINKGDLSFEESAATYGLDDLGYSMQASFFDMDNDNDLDMYLTNRPDRFFLNYRQVLAGKEAQDERFRDKLYRNEGGKFEEIGLNAGIVDNYGYGLGLATTDINQDGFTDIYVANDYLENDYLYINRGDGTFVESIKEYTNHIPFYSMGIDAVDLNNDGLEDMVQLDMLPADYVRSKTTMASMNVQLFDDLVSNGFHHQYMHNMLQLAQGTASTEGGFFTDIGQLSGISSTDWSWSCLGSDFDNDGFRDIFITNGFRRDIWDKDTQQQYVAFLNSPERKQQTDEENAQTIIEMFKSNKIGNYLFQNNQDLSFTNKAKAWGLDEASFSNGAAVGDLDNDGDLDIVVNNIEGEAFIYRNKAESTGQHYLKIQLKGPTSNTTGLGAKIRLSYGDELQYHDFKTVRGYLSSVEPIVHFGLGETQVIDQVQVVWPDGKVENQKEVATNQMLRLDYKNAATPSPSPPKLSKALLVDATADYFETPFVHQENDFDDYRSQILLPHQLSKLGPCLAVGDVNGDGLEDFFIGGAHLQAGQFFIQQADQQFLAQPSTSLEADRKLEDTGAVLFDADGDQDLDLYVVSGGNEFQIASPFFQDRLYLNDGAGNFQKSTQLPEITSSGSCVVPYDFDSDGDLDLFVGGRLVPMRYPHSPDSYLLQNEEGVFTDVTSDLAPALRQIGMVTDAIWQDIDQDEVAELIVVGEWMPITVFKKENGTYRDITETLELDQTSGWWNTINAADLDQDGDTDLLVGNLGLNYKYKASPEKPFHVFADDFDGNGSNDIFLAKYDKDRIVPIRGKECSSQQIPVLNKKFTSYKKFAEADLDQILEGKTKKALQYEAQTFASILLENEDGQLRVKPLPIEAQFSAVNGIIPADFNQDGKLDLLVAGNKFESEIETTRADGSPGFVFTQHQGQLKALKPQQSGFFMPYNVKDLSPIQLGTKGEIGILVAINDGPLHLYKVGPQ